MPTYQPGIPTGTVNLDTDYLNLQGNFSSADTSFGIDHYKFSDATANNGKHNQVTTPLILGSVHPTTAAAEPKFYAMQDSSNLGVLQYSRGPSNAVPTPLTTLQSQSAAQTINSNATFNIKDFTGLNRVYGTVFAVNTTNSPGLGFLNQWDFAWSSVGPFFIVQSVSVGANKFILQFSGNILQFFNTIASPVANLYWTLQYERIQ